MDHSVTMKMKSEEPELDWFEWARMATMWDTAQHKHSEDIFPLNAQGRYFKPASLTFFLFSSTNITASHQPFLTNVLDYSIPHSKSYPYVKTTWLSELIEGIKDIINRTRRGEAVEERIEVLLNTTSENRNKSHGKKNIETMAVTDIKGSDSLTTFGPEREFNRPDYWRINPWNLREVSGHLGESGSVPT